MSTPAPSVTWGPNLAVYLDDQLRARGLSVNAFADRTPGIAGADVTRWRKGEEPSLHKFRALATGLDLPLVDVLCAAGVMTEDELGRTAARTPSVDEALRVDPTIHDEDRPRLQGMVDAFREVRGGTAKRRRVR